MDASSSLADISLLLLADAAVPQYASAIVAALISVNQSLKSQVDTIQADVRSIRETIEELKEMRREERREAELGSHSHGNENDEPRHNEAPNQRDLAFSVYLREMKTEPPGETGDQRSREEEEEYEDDDDEMNEEYEEDEDQPGTSSAATAGGTNSGPFLPHPSSSSDFSSVAAALMNSLPAWASQFAMHQQQQTTVPSSSAQDQPCGSSTVQGDTVGRDDAATPGSSKRIILPCPRSGCEVLLYSQLGFSAHLRIHDGKMPFECTNCGREFRLRDGLVKHMRTHTGERPYPCQVCGKNFKRIHHRKKHLQQHIGTDAPTVSQ